MPIYLGKNKKRIYLGDIGLGLPFGDLSYVPKPSDGKNQQDLTTKATFINQSGYDLTKPKIATITNVADGTVFVIKKYSNNAIAYEGIVEKQRAVFSNFKPETVEPYYIECDGITSHRFSIGKYWTQRVSIEPTLKFMVGSREDGFAKDWKMGYAWRDSHQFSFELNTMAMQYMANPSAYDRMPYGITNLDVTEYPELATQKEPDIIWLLKFGVKRYHDLRMNHGNTLHAFVKGQLAYFLYIYPEIKQYVSQSFYEQIRNLAVAEWSNPLSDLKWYELEDTNDMFATHTAVGDIKGQRPPGHSIVPNLMMYEVAKRDGLGNEQAYFNAAYNNCKHLVDNIDLDDPKNTKGQRMSEHITLTGLGYFQEMYPDKAPVGLLAKINRWVDVMISRSNNLWDLRKHSDPNDITTSTLDQWTGGLQTYNEPGNVAGFMAPLYAAKRVIGDGAKKQRLSEIAISHLDAVFGRNPVGKHFSHQAFQIEGATETKWHTRMQGYGELTYVTGVLDGSPKEVSYPFDPAADPGYSEGWIAFNTAWNASLAYQAAEDVEIKVFDSSFVAEKASANVGDVVGVRLKAPLNFKENIIETGEVTITLSNGTKTKLTVIEASVDDFYFKSTYTVPSGVTHLDVSYGIGIFKKSVRLTVEGVI